MHATQSRRPAFGRKHSLVAGVVGDQIQQIMAN